MTKEKLRVLVLADEGSLKRERPSSEAWGTASGVFLDRLGEYKGYPWSESPDRRARGIKFVGFEDVDPSWNMVGKSDKILVFEMDVEIPGKTHEEFMEFLDEQRAARAKR